MAEDLDQILPKENEDAMKTKKATYEIHDMLSKGSFGAVFHVVRLDDKKDLAMKCESLKAKTPTLRHQARVYEALKTVISPHFLTYEDRGLVDDRFVFIVLKLVGKNLIEVLGECPEKKFSMVTALRVGEQTLAAIRDLHSCGYIHRDIKPDNFAVGREEDGNLHTIFVLDFKFARKFVAKDKDLRLQRQQAAFRGTPRYASITALSQKEQSRKDDVESWWYMIVEFMLGKLPWSTLKSDQLKELIQMKKKVRHKKNLKKLLKNTPEEYMTNIIHYVDNLHYNSIPDYDHIADQLETAVKAYYLNYTSPPDWDLMVEYKGPKYEKNVDEGMGKAKG